jgi:hypothetical protein
MSLRTASPSQARRRAQALELVRNAIMEQLPILRRQIRPDDLPPIFKRAFECELERTILAQISEPGRVDEHRNVNLHYARYFTLRFWSKSPICSMAASRASRTCARWALAKLMLTH